MEHPSYQALFMNMFKVQSLTSDTLSILHEPEAQQLHVRVSTSAGSSGSGGSSSSSGGGSSGYVLTMQPLSAHPLVRLFATQLHASENDLGRLFEVGGSFLSLSLCHIIAVCKKRGTSALFIISSCHLLSRVCFCLLKEFLFILQSY